MGKISVTKINVLVQMVLVMNSEQNKRLHKLWRPKFSLKCDDDSIRLTSRCITNKFALVYVYEISILKQPTWAHQWSWELGMCVQYDTNTCRVTTFSAFALVICTNHILENLFLVQFQDFRWPARWNHVSAHTFEPHTTAFLKINYANILMEI